MLAVLGIDPAQTDGALLVAVLLGIVITICLYPKKIWWWSLAGTIGLAAATAAKISLGL